MSHGLQTTNTSPDGSEGVPFSGVQSETMMQHPVLWETILRQIPAGAVIMEAHSETILLRNRAAAQILGLSEREAANPSPARLSLKVYSAAGTPVPIDDWPLHRAIRTGIPTHDEEVVFEPRR